MRPVGGVLLILSSVLALGAASSLAAGSATPISGTCYSDGSWYYSTNDRTVHSGNTAIKFNCAQAPGGGIAFWVRNANSYLKIGSTVYAPPTGKWQLIGNAPSGTVFNNVFKEVNSHTQPYSWTGSEYY